MNYEKAVHELLKDHSLLHLVAGLSAECGEVCGVFQKQIYKKTKLDFAALESELGDVLFYLTALANMFGFTLEQLQESNINKLKKRHR